MTRPLVTVNALIRQARADGAITIPENALVTPAAADWLQSTHVPVRQVGAAEPKPDGAARCYLIGNGSGAYVQTLLPRLERRYPTLEFLSCRGDRSARRRPSSSTTRCTRRWRCRRG